MDDLDREFDLLATSAERTASVQRAEVVRLFAFGFHPARLRDPDHQVPATAEAPPDTLERGRFRSAPLGRHLTAAYDAVLAHVKQRREDYTTLPDEAAKTGAVIEMRQIVVGARSLHRSLMWLDAARHSPLDLGTRYLVDELATKLVAPGADVTVVAGERSYGKVTNPLSSVFSLSGAPPGLDELAIVVFVPRREQRSGLLHGLSVHELGHAADDQHGLVEAMLATAAQDPDIKTWMAAAADEAARQTGTDQAAVQETMNKRLEAWIEEAACDALAIEVLGPTYLYSFTAVVGTSDLDRAGEDHPPPRQRIRLMLEQLDAAGWDPVLVAGSGEVNDWYRNIAAETHDYREPEERFCVDALTRLAPDVRAVISRHVGEVALTADEFSVVQGDIHDYLEVGIPPSQTRDRATINRVSIILGSWLFALRRQGGSLAALARAADVPELSRLLPKALEDVAILRAREEAK